MESEQAAELVALTKHKKFMFMGNKKRYIEVIQCSGEDMNLVLTNGIAPGLPTQAMLPHVSAQALIPGVQRPIISPGIYIYISHNSSECCNTYTDMFG